MFPFERNTNKYILTLSEPTYLGRPLHAMSVNSFIFMGMSGGVERRKKCEFASRALAREGFGKGMVGSGGVLSNYCMHVIFNIRSKSLTPS